MDIVGKDTRSVAISSKFSRSEADALRNAASRCGCTISSLVHTLTIKGVVNPRPIVGAISVEQWRALAPLASNLNQLARVVEMSGKVQSDKLAAEIVKVRELLTEVRNHLIARGGGR